MLQTSAEGEKRPRDQRAERLRALRALQSGDHPIDPLIRRNLAAWSQPVGGQPRRDEILLRPGFRPRHRWRHRRGTGWTQPHRSAEAQAAPPAAAGRAHPPPARRGQRTGVTVPVVLSADSPGHRGRGWSARTFPLKPSTNPSGLHRPHRCQRHPQAPPGLHVRVECEGEPQTPNPRSPQAPGCPRPSDGPASDQRPRAAAIR